MTIATGLRRQRAGQGFTLIELLLTCLLLLLLYGAVAFSFDSLQRGAGLQEAALQMEGLLHYARAQAAQTGRRVQLSFEEKIDDDFYVALGGLRVVWEPDPLEQPGVFVPLPAASDYVKGITKAVMVESVRLLDVNGKELASESASADDGSFAFDDPFSMSTPPINFYPDGSSDSAKITITSWDYDDPRRMEVKLVGVTGSIRRRMVDEEADEMGMEALDDSTNTDSLGTSSSGNSVTPITSSPQ